MDDAEAYDKCLRGEDSNVTEHKVDLHFFPPYFHHVAIDSNFATKLCEDEELKPKFKNRAEAESEEKICYQVFDESSRRETKK